MSANNATFDWAPDLVAFLRRSWRMVAVAVLLACAAGIAYMVFATPRFTSASTVFIDMQAAAPFSQQNTPIDSQFASGLAESQVEVLQSDGLARQVVRKLGLAGNAEFLANGNSVINSVLGLVTAPFVPAVTETPEGRETEAAELLIKMISVKRIGMSFILELSITARDGAMAARLTNAVTDAFVDAGLDAKGANTRRATQWLQQRIGELQLQASNADRAVQVFKAQAGIVDTDKGLMSERHLGELNSQLVLARARVSDTRSRLDRIQQIMAAGTSANDVSDALQNPVIIHLREQYVDAARQMAEWSAKVGPNHDAVSQMRGRLRDLQDQIQSELQRIAASTDSDYRVAIANQADIQKQLDALVGEGQQTNENLVKLRQLQSSADTYKSMHESFLLRYTQAVQDQSFPISEVRVVSRASVPLRKSSPKALIVLAASLVGGLAAGFGMALLREALDTGLRTAAQVRARLGLPCLAMLPVLNLRTWARRDRANPVVRVGERQIVAPSFMRQTLVTPFSQYAEAIRGLRIRLTLTREGRRNVSVIGCVSALPGEGKSTISANVAFFLAEAGFRTLLVDWDLRKRTLSTTLSPACRGGFAEMVSGALAFEDAIWHDTGSGLDFLPASAERSVAMLPSLNGSGVQTLLADLRRQYDFVVIDLPAMAPVADAAAAANLVDGVVLVVDWARTPEAAVRESVEQAAIEPQRLLGVVLNKVDFKALRQYPMPAAIYASKPLVKV